MKNRVRQPVHIEPKGWGREVWLANNELLDAGMLSQLSELPTSGESLSSSHRFG